MTEDQPRPGAGEPDPRPAADLQNLGREQGPGHDQPAAPAPEQESPPPMTGQVSAQPGVTDPREPARTQEQSQREEPEPPPVAAEQDTRAAERDTWGKPAEERGAG